MLTGAVCEACSDLQNEVPFRVWFEASPERAVSHCAGECCPKLIFPHEALLWPAALCQVQILFLMEGKGEERKHR